MVYTPPPKTKRCTAHKTNGDPCPNWAMKGKSVCWVHGGATPRGIQSSNFKHGRYSKALPENLSARWEDAQNDPNLLSLEDEIRLIDVLLKSNLDKLDTEESGTAWRLIRRAVDAMELAVDKEDWAGVRAALLGMRDVIDVRIAHYATEQEIRDKIDQRRKLVESIQKVRLQGENAVAMHDLMTFMGAVVSLLMSTITNKQELNAVLHGVDTLLIRDSQSVVTHPPAANGNGYGVSTPG